MATTTQGIVCIKCKKTKRIVTCKGCAKDFCADHLNEHHNELSEQLGKTEDQFNEFKIQIEGQKAELQQHELMKQIDQWEHESIEKIRQVANEVRLELSSCVITFITDQDFKFKKLREQLIQCRKDEDFIDTDIQFLNEELEKLKCILNNSPTFKIEYDSTSFINKIRFNKEDDFERRLSRLDSSKSNDNNAVHIIIDPSSKKLSIDPKTRSLQMKGAFFCEYFDSPVDALYFSIGYSFDIKKDAPIWITVEPMISRYHADLSFKNMDIRILLFEKRPHSTERRLLHMSSERSGYKSYLHLNALAKGSYEVIPVTFGGVLRARSKEVNERAPIKRLRENRKGNNFVMSKDYRDALEYVFDLFDFDDNKQLDRNEYNLWTIRTTEEEITDEDWSSIRQHVGLDVDENVSKEKFLKLNDLEVQDPYTSEQELWNGLKSLGFNYALELDMMCVFNLTVHINQPDLHLKPTSYVELAEIKTVLMNFLENKGQKIKLNNSSVQCFNYKDDCGSILLAENKSASNVRLSIQVKDSKNVALNLPIDAHKPHVINVRHDSTQVIWFAHQLESQRKMELDASFQVK
ncbi:unnamed protein product [Rotaria sp. Silwood1]|nr:unnamed protein product [Rotaria sp. Silwood1]